MSDFIYAFDISKDINHFKLLPEEMQANVEAAVVDVIYESFIVPGDQDYLMARMLATKTFYRGFFWAAAQSIEKFLKAYLLMNGIEVKNFQGHTIKNLFIRACKFNTSISQIDVHPQSSLTFPDYLSDFLVKFSVVDFIQEIDIHGSPNNRYNASGVEYNTGHLLALDSFVFQLRAMIGVIPITSSFKDLSLDLLLIFEKNNPWVKQHAHQAPIEVSTADFPLVFSSHVTKLDILRKNKQFNPDYKLALEWLDLKMKLPA